MTNKSVGKKEDNINAHQLDKPVNDANKIEGKPSAQPITTEDLNSESGKPASQD